MARDPSGSRAGSKRFGVDLHCHVYTPAAEALVAGAADTAPGDLFSFINDATREVNRQMMAAISDKLVDVAAHLSKIPARLL